MVKSIPPHAPPPMPDEATLQQLASIAGVPAEEREFFFESVRANVQKACELNEFVKGGLANKTGATLLRAARELYEVLSNLNKDEREFLEGILGSPSGRIFGGISSGSVGGLRETTYQLVELFSLVTGNPSPQYPHQAPQRRQRGRKSGLVKNWVFQDFVFDLYTSTKAAEGKLIHDKNRPGTTLGRAIRLLAPHLPHGLVPKRFASTLQRLQTRYNKIMPDLDDVEND
jgi:hypothetical protein